MADGIGAKIRHSGCIGCRLRRKRCGQEKPHCVSCRRNSILCTWPEPGNRQHAELLRRTNPTRRQEKSLRLSPVDQHHMRARAHDKESLIKTDLDTPTDPSKTFCLPSTTLQTTLVPDALTTKMRLPESRRLFDHYLYRTNQVMAVCRAARNPFLVEIIPMAMSSDLVLHSLLACSGVHYAGLAGKSADEVTWIHYGQAVMAQKYGLTQLATGNNTVLGPLLVASILLCIIEVRPSISFDVTTC